jgi:hypothetical protein
MRRKAAIWTTKSRSSTDLGFVETGRGRPLSAAAVETLFRELRETSPALLKGLTAHVLRHMWNDKHSELMDRNKIRPEDEAGGLRQ